jgi:hypothetical protein
MRPNFRRAVIAALLVASLAPGLAQARVFHESPRALTVEVGRDSGFFSMVWRLLTDVIAGRVPGSSLGSPLVAKDTGDNGGHLDPNGAPATATSTPPPPDNGGHLDPNG